MPITRRTIGSVSEMGYKIRIVGKRSGGYQDQDLSVVLDFISDATGFQARALGKHIKRLCENVKVIIESDEEITEVK